MNLKMKIKNNETRNDGITAYSSSVEKSLLFGTDLHVGYQS